jgi:beta-glucosidase
MDMCQSVYNKRLYCEVDARAQSIAAGDPVIDPTITNRSWSLNKTSKSNSYPDLNTILKRKSHEWKAGFSTVNISNPMVLRI